MKNSKIDLKSYYYYILVLLSNGSIIFNLLHR
nr:MAG TPA: hypothetical protein [Caudoviricetes sp.]